MKTFSVNGAAELLDAPDVTSDSAICNRASQCTGRCHPSQRPRIGAIEGDQAARAAVEHALELRRHRGPAAALGRARAQARRGVGS